jgi:thioredoxin 1
MRNLFYIIMISTLFVFTTCSSSGGNNSDTTKVTTDGTVTKISSEMFRTLVWDYKAQPETFVFAGDLPVIVDFYADWCRPCKMVSPIMEDLAKEYKGKIRIFKVNTDAERELSQMFNIRSIPAIMFVPKTGKPTMAVGAQSKESYVKAIQDVLLVKLSVSLSINSTHHSSIKKQLK